MRATHALLLLASAAASAGCAAPGTSDVGTSPAAGDQDTGDDLLGSDTSGGTCQTDESVFTDINAKMPTQVGSVVRINWEAEGATHTWVRYIDSLSINRDVPADDDRGATLRGLTADTDVSFRLVAELDGELWCSDMRTAHTTTLPVGLPEIQLTTGSGDDVTPGFMAMPILTADKRFAAVVDTRGNIVWAWEAPPDVAARSALYRVAFSLDGEALLVNAHSAPDDPGVIWRVPWDGEGIEEMRSDNIHRDFVELPDGTLAYLGHESRRLEDGQMRRGDIVVERAHDGSETVAWNMWEDYDHGLGPSEVLPEIDTLGVVEWAHANALVFNPESQAWLISLPELQAPDLRSPHGSLISVDRETAETNWELSHFRGDFDVVGPDVALEAPHSIQMVDGGLLTFNRGAPDTCSRATEVALDLEEGEAEVVWESQSESCLHVLFLGESHRRSDGDTLVMYSSAGQLDIVDGQGQPKWSLQVDLGGAFGFLASRSRLYGAPVNPL